MKNVIKQPFILWCGQIRASIPTQMMYPSVGRVLGGQKRALLQAKTAPLRAPPNKLGTSQSCLSGYSPKGNNICRERLKGLLSRLALLSHTDKFTLCEASYLRWSNMATYHILQVQCLWILLGITSRLSYEFSTKISSLEITWEHFYINFKIPFNLKMSVLKYMDSISGN